MKSPLLSALVCLVLSPAFVSAGECVAGKGTLTAHSYQIEPSKLKYSDKRASESFDADVTLEATSKVSMKHLDSVYDLGEARFFLEGAYHNPRSPKVVSIFSRAARVEGEHGRAKCIVFNAVKQVDPQAVGVVFLEAQDGGNFKLCISEEGGVLSKFSMGGSTGDGRAQRVLFLGVRMLLLVPEKGSNELIPLVTATSEGCEG